MTLINKGTVHYLKLHVLIFWELATNTTWRSNFHSPYTNSVSQESTKSPIIKEDSSALMLLLFPKKQRGKRNV